MNRRDFIASDAIAGRAFGYRIVRDSFTVDGKKAVGVAPASRISPC